MAEAKKQVTPRSRKQSPIAERNITLLGQVMQFLLSEPRILDSLPSNFELVILPEDDPELRQYNLELLDKYGHEGKPIVFARLKESRGAAIVNSRPDLYVPLAA